MGEKSRKSKTSNKLDIVQKIAFLSIFLSLVVVSILFINDYYSAFELKTQLYDLSGTCSLSLCDCKCYPTQSLPEIRENKVCGNDCYGILGIEGCVEEKGSCLINYR